MLRLNDLTINNPSIHQILPLIDLHFHSCYSDGALTPEEFLEQVSPKKFALVSITDHDSFSAYSNDFLKLAKKNQIYVLPGVEIYCDSDLDILVYDYEANVVSKEFESDIKNLITKIIQKRKLAAKKVLNTIKDYLTKENNLFPCLNWTKWSETEKNKFLNDLNFDNLTKINYQTMKIDNVKRNFVFNLNFIKLLLLLGIIDTDIIKNKEGVTTPAEIEKVVKKAFFKEVITWKYDDPGNIDKNLLTELGQSGLNTVLAHPGKSVYCVLDKETVTEKDFCDFIIQMVTEYHIGGVEIDYRNYRDQKLNYNLLAEQTLKKLSHNSPHPLLATAGSDTHRKIIN
ncbi:MAG: PHP domain-containing protein [Patescibacteria group bacterium]|nr:PHP domain-containing protein [Patescibacteria group bacterium]